jgi:hypothetical protein
LLFLFLLQKEQMALRIRFLSAVMVDGGNAEMDKGKVKIEEEGLTTEQIAKRREMEEVTCYFSLDNWRDCPLGIGLLVLPRTARERKRGLVPRVLMVSDYVSAGAFNMGVRAKVSSESVGLDRDVENEEGEGGGGILTSSNRGRINAWLPIYINEVNWKYSKAWAPSAFSIIATQFNDMFKPIHCLTVCAKLMIQSVVQAMIEEKFISEKSIQMYCDIHRLFLQMMDEYPAVREEAETKLKTFIQSPKSRIRALTPDLGDMITYLAVSDTVFWDDLRDFYVEESFRRNARHIGHFPIHEIADEETLVQKWSEGTNYGKVTMFNVHFLRVCRPKGVPLTEIKHNYDSRWGRLSDETLYALKKGAEEILKVDKALVALHRLGVDIDTGALAELILWALENKEETGTTPPYEGLPKGPGHRVMEWKWKHQSWKQSIMNPPPLLEYWPAPPKHVGKKSNLEGVGRLLFQLRSGARAEAVPMEEAECHCQRCQTERALQEKRKQWREKPLPKTAGDPRNAIFVGRLDYKTTEETLVDQFSQFGKVLRAQVVRDINGKSRGYAFVEFSTRDPVNNLVQNFKNSLTIDSRTVIIDDQKGRVDPSFLPRYLGGGLGLGGRGSSGGGDRMKE